MTYQCVLQLVETRTKHRADSALFVCQHLLGKRLLSLGLTALQRSQQGIWLRKPLTNITYTCHPRSRSSTAAAT